MRRLAPLALVAFVHCGTSKPSITVPAPIVTVTDVQQIGPAPLEPPQPALRLPRNFLPTSYAARLAIDPAKPTFDGAIAITGAVSERSSVIWLHGFKLRIKSAVARQDQTEVALTVTPKGVDLLEIRAATPLDAGAWTLHVEYAGDFEQVSTTGVFKQTIADASYVYTQLEAIYARRVFPCFDEPDNKVPWQLTLDVPAHQVAVANTPVTAEAPLGSGRRVEFARTKPMPSYLVAFAVGPFEIIDAGKTKGGTPLRVLTLAKRAAEGAWAAKTLGPLVEVLEQWFATPYPYEKLDVISIPITVGFGAMENAGLITFTETLILVDPAKASRERQHSWAIVAAHEIAHQWFGNLVTMGYWEDIWLNEGFANWMAPKATHVVDPTYRDEHRAVDTRHTALEVDALISARAIRQPIQSPDDILTAFDRITYDKGAAVLAMFERYLGAETFQRGVRDYLASRAWGNATSKDFAAAMAKASGNPQVEAAFSSFLDQPGAPLITATPACARDKVTIELAQQHYVAPGSPTPPPTMPWLVPVCVAYDKAGARAEACTLLTGTTGSLALDTRTCPRWVMPNAAGAGYYRTAYTTAQVSSLRDEAWPKLTWPERRALVFDLREAAGTGKLPLQSALSFVPKLLAGGDRFTISPALEAVVELDRLVTDDLRGKYEHFVRTSFGPGATAAGFVPRDTDTLDLEQTRGKLVGTVAWLGRDPVLVAEAVKLAERWRELPQAIRGLVLEVAADARADVFERLLKEVATESDRSRRGELFAALGSVRDPARQKQALALLLDRKLDLRETISIVWKHTTDANLAVAQQFVREHLPAILARLPKDETTNPLAGLAWLFTSTCRADQRDAVAAYVTQTFAKLPGGERTVKQAVEGMDQCIARRKLLEPEVKAWLSGLRLPKKK